MCIICSGNAIKTNKLYIRCDRITEIPNIPSLKKLECFNCRSLVKINALHLTKLCLIQCPKIEVIPNIVSLKSLKINTCGKVNQIYNIKGLNHLECVTCECIKYIPKFEFLEMLFICNTSIRIIPNIQSLKILHFIGSNIILPNITGLKKLCVERCYDKLIIPNIDNLETLILISCRDVFMSYISCLKHLSLYDCDNIKHIYYFNELISLNILNCPRIKRIPLLPKLETLELNSCQAISNIPDMSYMKSLTCINCHHISNITGLISLENLEIHNCKLIKRISNFKNIESIYVSSLHMLTELPDVCIDHLKIIDCKWIRGDSEYENNINRLIKLQKWFKKCIFIKRFINIIPKLIPLFYHPDAHGGYIHKRDMLHCLKYIKKN